MPSSKAVCPGRATKVFASELRPSLHIRIFAPTSQRLRATVLFLPAAKPKISFAENGTTPVNAVVPFLMQVTKQSIAVGFVILQTMPCLRAPSPNTQSLHRSQPPRQLRPPLALISPPDYVLSLSFPGLGLPNFLGAQRLVHSRFNVDVWSRYLEHYQDRVIIEFLCYGWPINY